MLDPQKKQMKVYKAYVLSDFFDLKTHETSFKTLSEYVQPYPNFEDTMHDIDHFPATIRSRPLNLTKQETQFIGSTKYYVPPKSFSQFKAERQEAADRAFTSMRVTSDSSRLEDPGLGSQCLLSSVREIELELEESSNDLAKYQDFDIMTRRYV